METCQMKNFTEAYIGWNEEILWQTKCYQRRPRKMWLVKLHSWKERFSVSSTETDGKQTKWKLQKENEISKEITANFCRSTVVGLETWKTRKSLWMCYTRLRVLSNGLLWFTASTHLSESVRMEIFLEKWSTSEMGGNSKKSIPR